jgi:hypothetical protein
MSTGSPSIESNGMRPSALDSPIVPTNWETAACRECGMAIPRPMPVDPSCSRRSTARTTSSVSVLRNCPAACRDCTISRITSSRLVEANAGMIASLTTKWDIRMRTAPQREVGTGGQRREVRALPRPDRRGTDPGGGPGADPYSA